MENNIVTLADISIGNTGNYGIAASAVDFSEKLPTYLRITDINDDGTINKSGLKSVDDPNSYKYRLKPNDIVFARTGASTGRNYLYDGHDGDFVYAGFLIKFSIDPLKAYPKFIKYVCLSQEYKDWVQSQMTGSTRGNMNAQQFGKFPIKLPPLVTQRKIASILSAIDDKIALNNRMNENLEEQIITLWNEKFNFSPDLLPNEEWAGVTLGDVTKNIRDKVGTSAFKVLSAVNTGKLELSEEYFTKQVFSKDIAKYIVVKENEFAYNPARVNIGSIGINDLGFTGCVSPVYVVFKAEADYQYFMKYFVKSKRFKDECLSRASGSVRQSMNYCDFALISLAYPPKSLVLQFNNTYESFLKHQRYILEENKKLAELRDTLLPKLMSGEIDVDAIEI